MIKDKRAGIGVRIERPAGVDLSNSMHLSLPQLQPQAAFLTWQALLDALLVALQHDLTVVHVLCSNMFMAGQVSAHRLQSYLTTMPVCEAQS
jgi:hypothetical protein